MRLKDNFPFSPYTVEAELALGDAYYLDERYPEAAESYKDFESMHPRHEAIPYVLYQVGMSDLKSFISVDRPTTAVQESLFWPAQGNISRIRICGKGGGRDTEWAQDHCRA